MAASCPSSRLIFITPIVDHPGSRTAPAASPHSVGSAAPSARTLQSILPLAHRWSRPAGPSWQNVTNNLILRIVTVEYQSLADRPIRYLPGSGLQPCHVYAAQRLPHLSP